jgi:hypothetical protein
MGSISEKISTLKMLNDRIAQMLSELDLNGQLTGLNSLRAAMERQREEMKNLENLQAQQSSRSSSWSIAVSC